MEAIGEPVAAPASVSERLAEGLRLHSAGRLAAAAEYYQQILTANPRHADALLLLGIAARQTGQAHAAVTLTRAAVALRPRPHYHLNLALALRAAGEFQEAEQACRATLALAPHDATLHVTLAEILLDRNQYAAAQAACEATIALRPGLARAHHGMGNIHGKLCQFSQAAACYRQAIALEPKRAESHFGLGYALNRMGDHHGARAALTESIRLRPGFVEAHLNLGNLHYDAGGFAKAEAHYRAALRLKPGYVKAAVNLGNALAKLGRVNDAIACYRRALALDPRSSAAEHGLGNALIEQKDWDAARACLTRAVELNPASAEFHNSLGNLDYIRRDMRAATRHYARALGIDSDYARAYVNLGNALLAMGKHGPARRLYERGLALDPASPGARYNLALAELRNGEFHTGWNRYEARWSFAELGLKRRRFRQPLWRGEPLAGKTLLLHAEQGLGDTLQFVRYAPLAAARGACVILEVQPPLVRLLSAMPGVEQVIPRGAALPDFDLHCPLMSLPLAFGTTLETIPSPDGYLKPDAKPELHKPGESLRVGISWSGNPRYKGDAQRSMPLEVMLPLAGIPGLQLISLQKGAGTEQIAALRDRLRLEDASSAHADMQETAELLTTLNLVLSVDTSIVHLAGAMGVPVWVMLARVADWRWMERRSDSPWYTSARLFRQQRANDWGSVITQIISALETQNRYTGPPEMMG